MSRKIYDLSRLRKTYPLRRRRPVYASIDDSHMESVVLHITENTALPVTYTFENTKTGKVFDDFMSMADKETYLEQNPHIKQIINKINIVAGVSGRSYRSDQGWKENMSRIAEAHPTSPLADRYGKKSIKQVKTREVIKKHRNRKKK